MAGNKKAGCSKGIISPKLLLVLKFCCISLSCCWYSNPVNVGCMPNHLLSILQKNQTMGVLTKIADQLYRRQRSIEIIAIFLFFSLVAFRFDSKKVNLFWSDYPSVAILLALTTALIVVIWLRIEKQKTQLLISSLQKANVEKSTKIERKLSELSLRQKEVFDLIVKGKSNKEIMAELNIELSTLKTHINQIYKILGIKSRKETKSLENTIGPVK